MRVRDTSKKIGHLSSIHQSKEIDLENRLRFTLWQQLICAKALYVNSNLVGPINHGFWNQGSPYLEDRAGCKGWLRALLLAVLKVMLEGLIYDNQGEPPSSLNK